MVITEMIKKVGDILEEYGNVSFEREDLNYIDDYKMNNSAVELLSNLSWAFEEYGNIEVKTVSGKAVDFEYLYNYQPEATVKLKVS